MDEIKAVTEAVGGFSYGGVFILAAISNLFLPVPEEVILLGMGYLTGTGVFNYLLVMAIFVTGLLLSDYFVYTLSYKGSSLVKKLVKRIEKMGYLQNRDYIQKHMKKIIFFSRFMIYLRFIGPVLAGYYKTDKKTFLKYDLIALVIYVNIFLGAGNIFHNRIEIATQGVDMFKNIFILLVVVLALVSIMKYVKRRFFKNLQVKKYVPTIIPGLSVKQDSNEDKK